MFSGSGEHKTKETYPNRPGSPTPCKQALIVRITVIDFSSNNLGFLENDDLEKDKLENYDLENDDLEIENEVKLKAKSIIL